MEYKESLDLDFGQYLLSLQRRFVPATSVFIITVTLATLASSFSKPSYQASGKLLFKLDKISSLTGLIEKSGDGKETGDLTPLVSTQNPVNTEIEILNSDPISQKVIDSLKLKNKKGEPLKTAEFKSRLTIKIIGGTDVVRLSYESRDPKEAAAVVNKVMSFYLENNLLTDQIQVSAARKFIAQQLPQTEANVRQAEATLRRFKEQNNVVDLAEEAKSAVAAIGNLNSQITSARADLEQVNAQTIELSNKVGLNSQEAIAVSTISQSRAVQGILQEVEDVEKKLAAERSRFQEQSPTVVSLEAKKADLEAVLQQQIHQVVGAQMRVPNSLLQIGELRQNLIKDFLQSEVQRLTLARRLDSLSNSRAALERRVSIIPRLEQEQRELQGKLEAAQSTYEALLKKLQEVQVEENKKTNKARVVEQAIVPEKPLPGSKVKILGLGVMLGSLFFTTTVLLLEIRDKSLKTLKEVNQLFGYPLLGVIPSFRKNIIDHIWITKSTSLEVSVINGFHSPLSEIYWMIQANLKFISSDEKVKIIVVTSSVSKEGKSTISANLAAALAQLGRQVLLIDADLRHPSQQHIWKLSSAAGLSEVLVGQADFWQVSCQVIDNLDVLTAGVMLSNPLALLDSKEMVSLMNTFSDKYDFVIVDAPPLIDTADALILSQMADGILLVARLGVVDYASVKAAKEMLERSEQNILGLVVNGLNQKKGSLTKNFLT